MTTVESKSADQPQSAAAPSPFTPIADYAFLSNCHTGALVAPDGAIDWLCIPSFDSPSVFGSLLDREAGFFRFGPFGISHPTARVYEPGTNVLRTTWKTPTGWVVVKDALTMGPWITRTGSRRTPVRRPTTTPTTCSCEPSSASRVAWRSSSSQSPCSTTDARRRRGRWSAATVTRRTRTAPAQTMRLRSDLALGIEDDRVRARHVLEAGDRAYCALSWAEELVTPQDADEAEARIAATVRFWRSWLGRARIPDHRFRDPLQRSALAIKGLTYMPTGATVAALTTSLPETPGGERNWDYRYTWMRDTTFTLQALHYLLLDWEADEFMQFVGDLAPNEDGALQIMYGIDGRRDLTETTRDDLTGYAGAKPVRIGNGAFDQRQNDVFGAVLDSILLHTTKSGRLPRRLWPIVRAQAECATRVWQTPDQGIWEARGEPKHYVSSKLMCWVALDRAAKLAEIRGDPELQAEWRETAEAIHSDVLAHGVDGRGVLRQHYEGDALDASTLLAAIFGFLPGDDERMHATVLTIADELTEGGFVLRYRTGETDDGLSGKEGTFLICSYWLVSAFAIVGEIQRARDLMERLLRIASPLGLYAEEFDADTGRHLGNFPQAFSHLALIEAAARIIVAERLKEISMNSYDVVIIGTGAGGGTLARHLAPSGKRILLLERGDWLPRELQNWLTRDVFVENRYVSPDTWYDGKGKPFQPQVHYFVGGATKLYGAALYRLREEDFGELQHHDGVSPAWPISYDELEPYYTVAEQLYQVHGARGRIRPSRGRARRTHTRPSRTSRESSSSRTTSRRQATSRSTRPAGSCWTSRTRRTARASAARSATATRALSTRSPTRRCTACARRSSTKTSRSSPARRSSCSGRTRRAPR